MYFFVKQLTSCLNFGCQPNYLGPSLFTHFDLGILCQFHFSFCQRFSYQFSYPNLLRSKIITFQKKKTKRQITTIDVYPSRSLLLISQDDSNYWNDKFEKKKLKE